MIYEGIIMNDSYIDMVKEYAKILINKAYQKEEILYKLIKLCDNQNQRYIKPETDVQMNIDISFFYNGKEYSKFIHFLIDDLSDINVDCFDIRFAEFGGYHCIKCRYLDLIITIFIYPNKENCKLTKVEVTEEKYILEC